MSHIQKSSENCISVLAATRDRLNQSVYCRHARPSPSWYWCPWVCLKWGEWSGIDLIFIDARVKINDTYYCEVLLTQTQFPVTREISGEFFIFQQGNVPAHRACETINLLKRDTCVRFTRPFASQQHRSELD